MATKKHAVADIDEEKGSFGKNGKVAIDVHGGDAALVKVSALVHPSASAVAVDNKDNKAHGALLNFPDVVDSRALRLNAVWGLITAVIVAITYKTHGAHWVMGGLLVEYSIRFIGGPSLSGFGGLTAVFIAVADWFNSKPRFVAGPPKQADTLVDLIVSAVSFLFYLQGDEKWLKVGLALNIVLGALELLDIIVGFSVGTAIFNLLLRIGLIPHSVLASYAFLKEEAIVGYPNLRARFDSPEPDQLIVKHYNDAIPTTVDVKYKIKHGSYDWNPIKHWSIILTVPGFGLVGLAGAWKLADPSVNLHGLAVPAAPYYAIGLLAAIYCGGWLLFYLVKVIFYPSRVLKELVHPLAGHLFTLPFVILTLFALVVKDTNLTFAKVLFWIGAPGNLGLSFLWVGSWFTTHKTLDHVNTAWYLMPVVNFVPAAIGPLLDPSYRDACQFWFSWAFAFLIILTTITTQKAITHYDYDEGARALLAIWVAAPAVAAVGYATNFLLVGTGTPFVFIIMHWLAIAMSIVLAVMLLRGYLGNSQTSFNASHWVYGFPSAALSMSATLYATYWHAGPLSQAIAYAVLFATTYIHATLLAHTAAALLRKEIVAPAPGWGPLSFLAGSHNALRVQLAQLKAEAAAAGNDTTSVTLRATWQNVSLVIRELARHEVDCLYPALEEILPGITAPAAHAYAKLLRAVDQLNAMLGAPAQNLSPKHGDAHNPSILDSEGSGSDSQNERPSGLGEAVSSLSARAESLLALEETHLAPVMAKYLSGAYSKLIIQKVWAATPPAAWHVLLPVLVGSLNSCNARASIVKALLAALPERPHQIGLILSKGLHPVAWRLLVYQVPEVQPRGDGLVWHRAF